MVRIYRYIWCFLHFLHADDGIVGIVVLQGFGPILWNVFGRKEDFATNIDAGSPAENDRFAGEIPATVRRFAHDPIQTPVGRNYIGMRKLTVRKKKSQIEAILAAFPLSFLIPLSPYLSAPEGS